ncbi:LysM domain-containing protein [Colletotrichum orchidophilum]|uniref:LysM domain-containing protein n=1 Tax=Colletotrichum orchidophilum TaxID=1209926 RepID=A0A1G4AWK1_9PEZI|nr:LysM domain-containing protein [Colletotrichum orchidophilum]OHE93540.1 LysM domain-containing protein [Colletotrichum orchidophilum]
MIGSSDGDVPATLPKPAGISVRVFLRFGGGRPSGAGSGAAGREGSDPILLGTVRRRPVMGRRAAIHCRSEYTVGLHLVACIASTPTGDPDNKVVTTTAIQDGMTKNCNRFHFVNSGDGCVNNSSNNSIALADLYSWNPAVGSRCGGLWAYVYVYVGIVGGGTVTTQPPATTNAPGNGISTPSPLQKGMTTSCDKFYFINSGDDCATIASSNSIALSDFSSWNTAVGDTCRGLWANMYVCVAVIGGSGPTTTISPASTMTAGNGIATHSPIQDAMVDNCNRFHMVKTGDGCAYDASNKGILLSDFYRWNPAVGDTCAGLWANVYVCCMVGNFNEFYKVKSGDGRAAITSSNGIALAKLYKWNWNPAVINTCASLWLDTAGNGVVTPTFIQEGVTKSCKTFHLVVGGDTCYGIAAKSGITLKNFYA